MENNLKIVENDLVPVYETSTGEKVVYGRGLWETIGSKQDFSTWVKKRLSECDAVENEDYSLLHKKMEQKSNNEKRGGWNKVEYIIKLDTAKEMAMLERNEKGKQVRRYFIEIEKRYKKIKEGLSKKNQLIVNIVNAKSDVDRALAISEYENYVTQPLIETIDKQEEEIKDKDNTIRIQNPFVQFALKFQNMTGTISMEQAAKVLMGEGINIGRNKLLRILRDHNVLMKNNVPYQKYMDSKLFESKMVDKSNMWKSIKVPVTRVTGKGLIFLNAKLREWIGMDPIDKESMKLLKDKMIMIVDNSRE